MEVSIEIESKVLSCPETAAILLTLSSHTSAYSDTHAQNREKGSSQPTAGPGLATAYKDAVQ